MVFFDISKLRCPGPSDAQAFHAETRPAEPNCLVKCAGGVPYARWSLAGLNGAQKPDRRPRILEGLVARSATVSRSSNLLDAGQGRLN